MDFFNVSFWQNFLSNLLATIIGVGLGIPVAFWINNRVQFNTENEKKDKIIGLLLDEIQTNYKVLDNWKKSGQDNWALTTLGVRLNDQTWNSFSDGGELHWIKSPLVLHLFANVYGEVKRVKYLSDKYLNFDSMPTSTAKFILADLTFAITAAMEKTELLKHMLGREDLFKLRFTIKNGVIEVHE